MQALDIRNDLGNTMLHGSVARRDHNRCRELLTHGANCHLRDLYGQTPLHLAVQNEDLVIAGILLDHGANVNERNCDHLSPLYTAARLGNFQLVKWLCERGADANLEQRDNWSVLHEAATSGSLDVVRYLSEEQRVKPGGRCPDGSPFLYAVQSSNLDLVRYFVEQLKANANEQRPFNLETPLHYAAETGRLDLVRYLVEECGARSKPSGFARRRPLDHAVEFGHGSIADYLAALHGDGLQKTLPYTPLSTAVIERSPRSSEVSGQVSTPTFGRTALHDAVLTSDIASVLALLNQGLDVNACDDAGSTPLLLAAERNDEAMVEVLLLHGAISDIRDHRSGKTLLHICAEMRHFGVLRRLLDANASPELRSADNTLVLHSVAEAGHTDLLHALITRFGVAVDQEGRPGDYAIGRAVWNRQTGCAKLLLQAEPQNPNASYKRAVLLHERWLLDLAVQDGWSGFVQSLVEYDAHLNGPGSMMHRAAKQRRFAHVYAILDATNLSIDIPDKRGRTLLHRAVLLDDLCFMRELAQRGASFAVGDDRNGERPVELAAIRGRRELLPFLIEATADLDDATKNGMHFIQYLTSMADTTRLFALAVHKGADPTVRTADGSTLLHLAACRQASVAVVRYLIDELHMRSNEPNDAGLTPLAYAMERRFFDIVETLLDKSVSMHIAPSDYLRTLFCAIKEHHWGAFFKMLLSIRVKNAVSHPGPEQEEETDTGDGTDQSACVNWIREARDARGGTFLHHAARQGNLIAVQRLVELSADVNARADYEKTVLLDAAQSGCLDVVRFLVEHGADVKAHNRHGKTILHLAAFYPERYPENVLAYLVQQGLDIDARTQKQDTALHFAIESRNLRLIRFLISQEAFMGIKGSSGETPLLFAAKRNDSEIVRLLVDAGCDVREQNAAQRTALHFAASHGDYDLVHFLVERGSDVNTQDQTGKSVLHWAVKTAGEATVQMLLNKGADPFVRDKRGQTPWALSSATPLHERFAQIFTESVKDNPARAVFRLLDTDNISDDARGLIEASGVGVNIQNDDGCPLLLYLIKRNRKHAVQYVLERGANPSECDGYGETPLHAAARRADGKTVRLLIHRCADVHVSDLFGTTVLHNAARSGALDLVAYLVETCQVDVHVRDTRGRGVCLAPAEKQHWNVVQYLLQKGVDIDCAGDFGRTVLHFAALWQHKEIYAWLVGRGADTGIKDLYGKTPGDYFL